MKRTAVINNTFLMLGICLFFCSKAFALDVISGLGEAINVGNQASVTVGRLEGIAGQSQTTQHSGPTDGFEQLKNYSQRSKNDEAIEGNQGGQ